MDDRELTALMAAILLGTSYDQDSAGYRYTKKEAISTAQQLLELAWEPYPLAEKPGQP